MLKEQNREELDKYGIARISEPGEPRCGVWVNCKLFPGTDVALLAGSTELSLGFLYLGIIGPREFLTMCLHLDASQRGSERSHQKVLLT